MSGIELLDESCGELLVNCAVRLSGLCLFKFRLYIGGIFSNGVEFGNVAHEFIVKLGLLVELDGVELALEGAVLTCERLLVIICREGNIYVELVADRVTDDLLLKSGVNEPEPSTRSYPVPLPPSTACRRHNRQNQCLRCRRSVRDGR